MLRVPILVKDMVSALTWRMKQTNVNEERGYYNRPWRGFNKLIRQYLNETATSTVSSVP